MSFEIFGVILSFDSLLSGAIAAIIVFVLGLLYQEWKEKAKHEHHMAKKRLEHIYGPLMLMLDFHNMDKSKEEHFLFTNEEEEKMDKLLFQYYYLIEDKRKSIILNLYSYQKYQNTIAEKVVIQAIRDGYKENVQKARLVDWRDN